MSDLSNMHTKVLLKMLDSFRGRFSDWEWENMDAKERKEHDDYVKALKDELAKRPHIPNKIEAKKIRQEAAKRKR